ncbi:leucine-rich repeat domain-containing protein [Candidatus Babeliales bacterium]|nr:leucine-rich repeat domain-containing protein [Candidatus Babeliales bacterium]
MKAKILSLLLTYAVFGTIQSAQGPSLPNESSDLQKQHALLKYIDPVELNNALFLQGIKRQAAALWSAPLPYFTKTPFEIFKDLNPEMVKIMEQKDINWELSLQDLIDAGGIDKLNGCQGRFVYLSLTSSEGLSAIQKVLKFKELSLSYNRIDVFDRNSVDTFIEELHFSNNNITEIDTENFPDLPNLKRLQLWANKLTHIPSNFFNHLTGLTSLSIANNFITEIPMNAFIDLRNLLLLDLSGNKIRILGLQPFHGLEKLETLFLDKNKISEISSGAFSGPTKLEQLSLEDNPITIVEEDAFWGLPEKLKEKLEKEYPCTTMHSTSSVLSLQE